MAETTWVTDFEETYGQGRQLEGWWTGPDVAPGESIYSRAGNIGDYVPVWRPPPPMPSERPPPVPPVPEQPENVDEDRDMSHTWGHTFREAAGGILGMFGGGSAVPQYSGLVAGDPLPPAVVPDVVPGAVPVTGGLGMESCEGMVWNGGTPPRGYKVVNWCGRGVLRKVRRRRRKRILTASDSADIATIVGLVGKGQMASALINRTRT